MNITLLTGRLCERAGGLYRAIVDLGNSLSRSVGLHVTLKCLRDPTGDPIQESQGLKVEIFESSPLAGGFGFSACLRKAVLSDQADVLHVHGLWTYPSIICNEWYFLKRRPYIVSPHGMLDAWALRQSRSRKFLATALYQRKCLARAACIHALTEQELNAIRDFGVRTAVLVQPNGVELLTEDELLRANRERRLSNYRSLLFLGRLHPKKGIIELLDGWYLAKKRGMPNNWRLVVCGWKEGEYKTCIELKIHERRLHESVELRDGVTGAGKLALLENAHAFVLPSYSEGLPIAVLEAWAHGLPVIMTPQCNLPAGFAERAALRCSLDPEDIARAIFELTSLSDSARELIGAKGHGLVHRNYNSNSAAQSLLETYQWALGQSPAPKNVFV